MNTLIAIDPGLNGCGFALFRAGLLERAAYVKNVERTGNKPQDMALGLTLYVSTYKLATDDKVVCELPQVYTQDKLKGDPNDLIYLALVVGALVFQFGAKTIKPREWKGQLPKEVCNNRVRSKLSLYEIEAIDTRVPASLRHNVLDAVGIGLHELGRF
jgi:hypothetical protein